jgi:predicted nucleotidyltransferase
MASGSDLVEILIKLLAEVERRNIEYALAGGWAFSVLVEPRATTDIDLLILLDSPSQEAIRSLASSVLTPTIVHSAPMNLKHISMWRCIGLHDMQEVIIDFLLADSPFLKSALARRQQIALGNQLVATLTLEDLMLMKMLAGRLQDQADLEKIDECKEDLQIDWSYIDQWKAALGLK